LIRLLQDRNNARPSGDRDGRIANQTIEVVLTPGIDIPIAPPLQMFQMEATTS
jgi:hypothetical protein